MRPPSRFRRCLRAVRTIRFIRCVAAFVPSVALSSLPAQAPAVPSPGASPPALIGPGVSADLAAQRRGQLRDVHYALSLTVGSGDTASGRVTVGFTTRRGGDVILDFRGLAVSGGAINGSEWRDAAASWNRHHVVIPAARLRPGRNSVMLTFATPVASAGAAIIRTRDAADGSTYLYTLLVPSDANLLFPSFDQPDLKARVTLTLTTPRSWRALANGALQRVDTGSTGHTHHFASTKPLSTYLIAFAAGPWSVHTRPEAMREGGPKVPMSLYVRASRAREAEHDTLVAMNARALRWLGQYFGVPYGFDKYDALLAPAFPFGGMEHPGAVFYNEESFIYRERPTTSQLLGRQATTFHEVAHQWFGDYVTMRWFDDLWLKEGFATFMAARMQADLEPASNAWKTFYLRNKPVAYGTDATAGTTPVWQALANLDQAKSNYGPIVYNKAPSVLKQLEYLVGPAAFQRGVQQFLRQHAYGNATWQALLASIGAASGRDLSAWGRQWMLRPGMPVVRQELTVANGRITRLALVQRPAQPALSGAGAWPLKVQVRLHYTGKAPVRVPVELTGDTTIVRAAIGQPAPDFVYANEGDYGYAIVLPDSASVRWLEQHVASVRDDFLRAMLWGALWDLVREAQLSPARYARMVLRALPAERDEQLSGTLVGRLGTSVTRYAPEVVREALLPEVERLLLLGAADTTRSYGIRKNHLDAYVSLAQRSPALAQLRAWLAADSAAGLPLRAPSRWAIVTRLVSRGATDADSLIAAQQARDATSEGARLAFVAGAAKPDSAMKSGLFDRWFREATLNEEWVTSSLRAFHEPEQQPLTRRFLRAALDTLPWIQQNRRIFFLGSWLGATLGGQTERAALAIVDDWLAERPTLAADLRQKVLQARDDLERTVRIRERFAPDAEETAADAVVDRWLTGLHAKDTLLLRETLVPTGWTMLRVGVGNGAVPLPRPSNDSALFAGLATRTGRSELAARTRVMHGALAHVWAPYRWVGDDDRVQGCGADLFTLVKTRGSWRLAGLSSTAPAATCTTDFDRARPEVPLTVSDRAAVVGVAEALLRALSTRDTAALRPLVHPDITLRSIGDPAGPRTSVSTQDAAAFFRTLPVGRERLLERLWAPTAYAFGPIVEVHAPYDFYIDGRFSHCGTDVFTLVKPGDRWLVSQIAYTVQRTGCPPSPLGPPR